MLSTIDLANGWTWVVLAGLALIVLIIAGRRHAPGKEEPNDTPSPLTSEQLTRLFISALPTMTSELNLEVATTTSTEVFDACDEKRLLGIPLGANTAQIRIPVTYRYHIGLYEGWKMEQRGEALLVMAPRLRAAMPPAVHTDRLDIQTSRGWARRSPAGLKDELLKSIGPVTEGYAESPERLSLVRETCRRSVAEFVAYWLAGQEHAFKSIQVQFIDEPSSSSMPVYRLGDIKPRLLH